MPATTTTQRAEQLALLPPDLELHEAAVQKKARQLFVRSRYLSGRFASFNKLMADPVTGRCVRLAAEMLVRRSEQKTRNR